MTTQMIDQTLLVGDEQLLVPRLVARIAELEHQLYSAELKNGEEGSTGLLDKFASLLKRAQHSLDASVAYIVGEVEAAQAAQKDQPANSAESQAALTKEATAKSLLITLKRLQSLKEDKACLEQRIDDLRQQLEAAQAGLDSAAQQRAALLSECAEMQTAAEALSAAHRQDQEALATVTSELERLQGAQQAAQAAQHAQQLEAQAAQHAQQLEAQATQHAQQAAARCAEFDAQAAALQREAAEQAQRVAELSHALREAQELGRELERQLEASQHDCQRLQQEMTGAGGAMEALTAEAEGLRAARAAVAQELNETRVKLERARSDAEEFQRRFLQERLERRKVHEQLQVLRGNIRVICRVRPMAPGSTEQQAVSFPYPGTIVVAPNEKRMQEFEFDAVFDGASSQESVFDEVAPLIRSCADGYNACIFAYGQTGSGKTHTMQGPDSNPGLSVRALQALFDITAREAQGGGQQRTISVSMLEIYNEAVRDLLTAGPDAAKPMEVSGLGAGQLQAGMERVPGLTWRSMGSVQDVLGVLAEGSKSRATAATAMNAHSSRSHALLSVRLTDPSGQSPPTLLHLVDLAGSERIAKSEVAGQQLREAQAINKSLSALGDVIAALQAKSGHVPYRNSKLTAVLQDSLCGSSKVLLVCCVSPEAASGQESLSSLNFASRAAQVELGPIKKVQDGPVRKAGEGSGAGRGSPMTPSMTKSRLGGTPVSAGLKRSVLREANTPL